MEAPITPQARDFNGLVAEGIALARRERSRTFIRIVSRVAGRVVR